MNKQSPQEIVSEILKLFNEPDKSSIEQDKFPVFLSFNYNGEKDIKELCIEPCVAIYGEETVAKYNNLFSSLYDALDVKSKLISLKIFKETIQQYFFTNTFTIEAILKYINENVSNIYNCVAPIWGMSMKENILDFGKFKFVKKTYLKEYILSQTTLKQDFLTKKNLTSIEKDEQDEANFIYLLISYKCRDSVYADELFVEERKKIINALRYMLGTSGERFYIGEKEFISFFDKRIQFTDKIIFGNTYLKNKDVDIVFETDYYFSKEDGNYYIWEMLNKTNPNQFEKRILNSIDWIGRSLNELAGSDISITEIAFAFETLLKRDESVTPITSSIQGSISEIVAYIVGKTLEDRLKIINEFKKFYSKRSAIVHGRKVNEDINMYYNFLYIFKAFVIEILTNKQYENCSSINDLYQRVDKYKYRV